MGTSIDWDDFDSGDYPAIQIKFKTPNDSAVGTVINVQTTDFGGTSEKVPELWIRQDDGTEVSVAASQVNLRRLLCQLKPTVGDRIAIVYLGDGSSSKAGMSPPKLFDVKVVPGVADVMAPVTVAPDEPTVTGAVSADSLI